MREGWNVILRYDPSWRSVNVWLIKRNQDGSEVVVEPVNLTMTRTLTLADITPEPTLRFQGHEAEQFLTDLASALVEAGYRPDALKASDKEIAALKEHLKDMRTLVFEALLPPSLPEKYLGVEDKKK